MASTTDRPTPVAIATTTSKTAARKIIFAPRRQSPNHLMSHERESRVFSLEAALLADLASAPSAWSFAHSQRERMRSLNERVSGGPARRAQRDTDVGGRTGPRAERAHCVLPHKIRHDRVQRG